MSNVCVSVYHPVQIHIYHSSINNLNHIQDPFVLHYIVLVPHVPHGKMFAIIMCVVSAEDTLHPQCASPLTLHSRLQHTMR